MRIASVVVAVVVAWLAVLLIKGGLREWRNAVAAPLSQRFGSLADEQTRAGYDRSGVILGLACVFMAIMLIGFAIINLKHPAQVEAIIEAVSAVGMIICFGLTFLIITFNKPKLLVPPRHREEPGVFGAQRRRRKGQHVA